MDALRAVKYEHCKSIRFIQTGCEDEGVRAICNYIAVNPQNVALLDLMHNEITPLGCQFISRILAPEAKGNLLHLKLDHNNFGSDGIKALAQGLNMNKTLTTLSLNYCNIDKEGADALFEILIYQ